MYNVRLRLRNYIFENTDITEPDNERSWAPDNLIGYRHWLVVNIQSGGTDDSGETLTKYEVCKTTNELSGNRLITTSNAHNYCFP